MRKLAIGLAGIAVLSSAACHDVLTVADNNSPDVARSYSSPSVLDNLISTSYSSVHKAIYASSTSLDPQLQVAAFENYATVANFSMELREQLPRGQIDNSVNNFSHAENAADFSNLGSQVRYSANYILSLDALTKSGGHLGNPTGNPATDTVALPGQDLRARSFAFFSNGVALGVMALEYDSAAIVTPSVTAQVPPLSSYSDVMKAALAELDTALAVATNPKAAAGFPLPTTYLNQTSGATYSLAQYVALLHSYKARFRAGVARTPADRAAVDWTSVIADATAGIQADFVIPIASSAGWPLNWLGTQMFASNAAGWSEMSLMIFGMADTTGAYDSWLKQPLTSRIPFLVKTGDKRWPSGETRALQIASNQPTAWDYSKYPYIRNRSGADPPGDAWGSSFYDFFRFSIISTTSGNVGPWIQISKVENDMLAAEGDIRKSDYADAAALINKSRTKAGLPAVTATVDGGLSGATCVPRVPTSAGNATQCGNLMEALKYEKRMETAYTGYGQWFIDSRGWGDLPEGTPEQWPVPYGEMQARTHPFYNLGGLGGASAATKGTYGF